MSYTLDEVSAKTGLSQAHLRKMIERGQIKAEKDGNRTIVTDRGLEDFMAARILEDAADAVRLGDLEEAKGLVAMLPDRIRSLLLQIDPAPFPKLVEKPGRVNPMSTFRPAPKPGKKK